MKRTLLLSSLALLLLPAQGALSAEFLVEDEVRLTESVSDDVYSAGGGVTVVEGIQGDFSAVGGNVVIHGAVSGDVNTAGGNVRIEGPVGDDVRVAAGEVFLSGTVGGDAIIFGGTIHIDDSASIRGDLIVNGGQVYFSGTVGRKLLMNAGAVSLSGTVSQDSEIHADNVSFDGNVFGNLVFVSKDVTLSKDAVFGSNVDYWVVDGPMDFGDVVKGEATYRDDLAPISSEREDKYLLHGGILLAIVGVLSLFAILSALLVIVILTFLTKTYFPESAKEMSVHPGTSFLTGIIFLTTTPVVGVLFLITIIGMPIGFAILAGYLFTLLFSRVLSAMVITKWLQSYYKKDWGTTMYIFISLVLYIVLRIIGIIPIIGWIAVAVLVSMALGALLQVKWRKFQKIR